MTHLTMRRGPRTLVVLASTTLLAFSAPGLHAQTGAVQTPRERLRQRYSAGRDTGSLSDAVHKLRSERLEERLEAIRMLAKSPEEKSTEYLLSAATDPDMRVRIKAIDALGNRQATDATPLFIQQLFLRETGPEEQRRVLAALGKIADPRSTQAICDFLSRDLDASTRGTAIFALGEIGDETALEVLRKLAGDGHDAVIARLADEAVRKITRREPPPVEIPALAEGRPR